jgi:dihydrolipoamide dehydrogenase
VSDLEFDLVVIGGGPAGYVASIRAAQLGMRTACIEKADTLGGTCLNIGCIPSKALLHSSERYSEVRNDLDSHGISVVGLELDLLKMMDRKRQVVADLTRGIAFLLDKNGVSHIQGTARIESSGEAGSEVVIELRGGGSQSVMTRNVLIATGSESTPLAGVEVDEKRIVSSTGALSLESVPETMIVVGAGVIGLELGSVWARLGARVTVIEFLDHILPGMDREVTRLAQRILKKQGLAFELSQKVTAAAVDDSGVALEVEPVAGGDSIGHRADVVLVAIGRRPFTSGLGLEKLGVETDERGFIRVDSRFATSVSGVFAIGDCIPGPMLAHKAEDEGVVCVEMIAGQSGHIDYDLIPGVVYTHPEIAGVGKTEERLKSEGIAYKVGKFPFSANSRGRAIGETDGIAKVLADAATDRILGVHIIGPLAGDLLAEVVIAMEFGASAEDIARTSHAHPSMGEAIREAALAVAGRAIHV